MAYRVAVDIGGTFTDAVAVGQDGFVRTAKAISTPGALTDGVLDAVRHLGIALSEVEWFVHGTTAGLNALLERRGARVALLTTQGFRDVYAIGRASRPAMYDLHYRTPAPLVADEHVYEVVERLGPFGEVVRPLDTGALEQLLPRLRGRYDAIAVVLLHSYSEPAHEQAVAAFLAERLPGVHVVLSSDVAPEWREFERTSTTATSAYIAPIVRGYLERLGGGLAAEGLLAKLRVMQSNGGVMSAATAGQRPVQTLFSGPVGGTVAGVALARDLGADKLVCADMGGTSFDVSLVVDGAAEVDTGTSLEGLPLLMPAVGIHTIGAGGGSVGYLTAGGLRVGPRSAGAVPGPACYGRGGTEPTVTDANLLLGRLPGTARLGGDVALDIAAAERAMQVLADELRLDRTEVAAGVVAVADAAMANAIREITVARGIDPREFDLVAFGGAAALHAAALADDLGMRRVIVPAVPGVLSARGMLDADTRHDLSQPLFSLVADIDPDGLRHTVAELAGQGRRMLAEEGTPEDRVELAPAVDLRYVGQEYTLTIPWDLDDDVTRLVADLPKRFADAYLDRYGHNNPSEEVECIAVRLVALGRTPAAVTARLAARPAPQPTGREQTRFGGQWHDTPVYWRDDVGPGVTLAGPTILLETSCTTVVPPQWSMTVSDHGHLTLERTPA